MKALKILAIVFGIFLLLTGGALLVVSAVAGKGQTAINNEFAKSGYAGPVKGTVTAVDSTTKYVTVGYTDKQGQEQVGEGRPPTSPTRLRLAKRSASTTSPRARTSSSSSTSRVGAVWWGRRCAQNRRHRDPDHRRGPAAGRHPRSGARQEEARHRGGVPVGSAVDQPPPGYPGQQYPPQDQPGQGYPPSSPTDRAIRPNSRVDTRREAPGPAIRSSLGSTRPHQVSSTLLSPGSRRSNRPRQVGGSPPQPGQPPQQPPAQGSSTLRKGLLNVIRKWRGQAATSAGAGVGQAAGSRVTW